MVDTILKDPISNEYITSKVEYRPLVSLWLQGLSS